MLVPSLMPTGLGLVLVQDMELAMVQGIGAIRSATMGFLMGPMGQRDSDGMADMEVSVRHVPRLVRPALGRPYLPIRHRGLGKATEWLLGLHGVICSCFSSAEWGSDGGSAVLG